MPKRIDMSEEERIVVFTKRQLQDKPFLNAKLLREQLLSNYDNLKLTKNISELSPKSLENYIMMAKCLFRLSTLMEENAAGTEEWSDEDYDTLQASGILLNNSVRKINKLTSQAFLFVLKKVVAKLPCTRDVIDRTVISEIKMLPSSDITQGSHDEHNRIKELAGKQYLYNSGCRFVSTEVTLEKGKKPVRGLKIDVYGWKSDGTICGIEVKTTATDYFNTQADLRFGRYARYVNEMYILTTDEHSYYDAVAWKKIVKHDDVGVLLFDKETSTFTKQNLPVEPRKEVTSTMLACMHKAILTKTTKLIKEVDLQRDDYLPAHVIQKIQDALKTELHDFI